MMTTFSYSPPKKKAGFTLIDLMVGMALGAIVLVGFYKVFMTNVETTSKALDLAALDTKTRNVVRQIQTDVSDINGNQLRGFPTVFPTHHVNEPRYSFNGFVLIKADKRFPYFTLYDHYNDREEGYSSESWLELAHPTIPVNYAKIKKGESDGQFSVYFNFSNYAWRLHKINNIYAVGGGSYAALIQETYSIPEEYSTRWISHLQTEMFRSYNVLPFASLPLYDRLAQSNLYFKWNSAGILVNIIRYEYDPDLKLLYRIYNENELSKSVIATNVEKFEVTFPTKKNPIYGNHPDYEQVTLEGMADFSDYINNLIPNNDIAEDDCTSFLGYHCKYDDNFTPPEINPNESLASLTPLAMGYVASNISGIDISMKIKTEGASGKTRKVDFLMTLDDNFGDSSLEYRNPTRIIATSQSDDRPYAAQITNPTIYGDPEGGVSSSPFYTAAAPMVSVPYLNDDDLTNARIQNLCEECSSGTITTGCPEICQNNNYQICLDPDTPMEERFHAGCGTPQGSLNDSGLDDATNRIDPKIVFLNQNSSIQEAATWDLSKKCGSGRECILNPFYSSFDRGINSTTHEYYSDTAFPMVIWPDFDNGVFYMGVARMRWPRTSSETLNYKDKYYSTVFAIKDPNHTSSGNFEYGGVISDANRVSGDPVNKFDLDSVSQLTIRDEGGRKYMYISSHNSPSLGYRVLDVGADPITGWSDIHKAFDNKDDSGNPAADWKKFLWPYQQSNPCYDNDGDGPNPPVCKPGNRFIAFPDEDALLNDSDSAASAPWLVKKRIANILAPTGNQSDRIYFTEIVDTPDQLIDDNVAGGRKWFYRRQITYHEPIIHPTDGLRYTCHPDIHDSTNPLSVDYIVNNPKSPLNGQPACTIEAFKPKPISWSICLNGTDPNCSDGNCSGIFGNDCLVSKSDPTQWAQYYPNATNIIGDYSSALKVAFKINDYNWKIKTIAYIHDSSTALLQDPQTGNLYIGGPHNIREIDIDLINDIMDSSTDIDPFYLDLNFKRPVTDVNPYPLYSANNVVSSYLDPDADVDELEFRKLSGVSLYPDVKNLNIVFTDMVKRELGYIIKKRDTDKDRLRTQIVYNEDQQGFHDPNLDLVMVYDKGVLDRDSSNLSWVMPYKSTSAWTDPEFLADIDQDGVATAPVYPIAGPIPVYPDKDIFNYGETTVDGSGQPAYSNTGAHNRNISNNPENCFADPTDTSVCSTPDSCVCGQDTLFRACAGDVLSQVSIGLLGRQSAKYGCGLEAPYATDDPMEPEQPPAESSGGGGGDKFSPLSRLGGDATTPGDMDF